jgi:hypothetical protein
MSLSCPVDRRAVLEVAWCCLLGLAASGAAAADISQLDQHFNVPGEDIAPWMFVPAENVKEFSTEEHPGLATIYEAGAGQDVKGVLSKPIGIDDYALPWEFQTSLVQSFNLTAGVGAGTQVNAAIGMNVAVTFSDPATWPADRTQRPPDTHEFQLLVVHLGCTGEAGAGLPQFSREPHPETYLVWGRGDLGHTVMGDWQIPYVWIGDGAKYAGPASPQLYFRCVLQSPTQLAVGIKFEASHGWNMRTIDCSEYGQITGVWEMGPIISADRWIPDVLCRNLPQIKGPHPLMLGAGGEPGRYTQTFSPVIAPRPEPPNPKYEYYVDYCVFFGSSPRPFEAFSDEFNILGYLGRWQVQEQCTLMDTHSYPGHLMLKLLGPGLGTGFGAAGGSSLKLSDYPPPWEIETRFIPPDDNAPWNYWMNFILRGTDGRNLGMWTPGVENDSRAGRHRPFEGGSLKVKFSPEVPEAVLAHKPLSMLIQCLDDHRVRLGFRAEEDDPWLLSEPCDVREQLGGELAAFDMHCWSTTTGRMYGARPGAPMYQKILVDYVRYRYGLSAPPAVSVGE